MELQFRELLGSLQQLAATCQLPLPRSPVALRRSLDVLRSKGLAELEIWPSKSLFFGQRACWFSFTSTSCTVPHRAALPSTSTESGVLSIGLALCVFHPLSNSIKVGCFSRGRSPARPTSRRVGWIRTRKVECRPVRAMCVQLAIGRATSCLQGGSCWPFSGGPYRPSFLPLFSGFGEGRLVKGPIANIEPVSHAHTQRLHVRDARS